MRKACASVKISPRQRAAKDKSEYDKNRSLPISLLIPQSFDTHVYLGRMEVMTS